jgi:hypothetical protein
MRSRLAAISLGYRQPETRTRVGTKKPGRSVPTSIALIPDPSGDYDADPAENIMQPYGGSVGVDYQVLDQYGAAYTGPGTPVEFDSSYTTGLSNGFSNWALISGPIGGDLDSDGQYSDSPIGMTTNYAFSNSTQQDVYVNVPPGAGIAPGGYYVGSVSWTFQTSSTSAGPVNISGSNGVSVTFNGNSGQP